VFYIFLQQAKITILLILNRQLFMQIVKDDQKVFVHLVNTVQKTPKNILKASFTMIRYLELRIIDGVSVSLVSPWPWRSAAKQSDLAN
jgi:hypothetical protein